MARRQTYDKIDESIVHTLPRTFQDDEISKDLINKPDEDDREVADDGVTEDLL